MVHYMVIIYNNLFVYVLYIIFMVIIILMESHMNMIYMAGLYLIEGQQLGCIWDM